MSIIQTNRAEHAIEAEVKSLKFAVCYDSVIFVVGLIAWFFWVRPFRRDHFHPYSVKSSSHDHDIANDTTSRYEVYRDFSWIKKLWNWRIEEFKSTDAYFYLSFHKTCAILFYVIALLTLTIGFPLIYTAQNFATYDESKLRVKTFFEKAVITNIPSKLVTRLWILYYLTLIITFLTVYTIVNHYSNAAKNELHISTLQNVYDKDNPTNIMANKCSIIVTNIDRNLAAADKIYHALMSKFAVDDVAQIHLVMDHSAVLSAYKEYKKKLVKLKSVEKQIRNFKVGMRWYQKFYYRYFRRRVPEPVDDELLPRSADTDASKGNDEAEYNQLATTVTSHKTLSVDHLESRLKQKKMNRTHTVDNDLNVWENIRYSTPPTQIYPVDLLDEQISKLTTRSDARKLRKLVSTYRTLEHECEELYTNLERKRALPPARNVGIAFVSFSSLEALQYALSYDMCDTESTFTHTSEVLTGCKWNSNWIVRAAPAPNDIIWENIHYPFISRVIRCVVSNLCVFLTIVTLTSSTFVADMYIPLALTIEQLLSRFPFLSNSINGWIVPNIMYLINFLILPQLVAWAARFSKYWRRSTRDKVVLQSNATYLVINTIFLPLLGATSIQALLLYLGSNDIQILLQQLGDNTARASSSFILRYVINTTFINFIMQLLQIPMCINWAAVRKLGRPFYRWDFDFGFWYAFHLSFFAVSLCFSIDFPFIPLMGGIFFTLKYWCDKYNMTMRVWKTTSESGGTLACLAVNYMLALLAVFLLTMGAYFAAISYRMSDTTTQLQQGNWLFVASTVLISMTFLLFFAAIAETAQRTLTIKRPNVMSKFLNKISKAFRPRRRAIHGSHVAPRRFSRAVLERLRSSYIHPLEKF